MTPTLLTVLLHWAVLLSPYPAPAVDPVVRQVSHSEIVHLACADVECGVKAWFDNAQRVVFIDEHLDPENTYVSSIIVHELVHYLQPATMSCREREVQAWGVQQAYLTVYGDYLPIKQHFEGVCT